MNARNLIAACKTFFQLHGELQTYTDAQLAELGLTRPGSVRVAFAAAFEPLSRPAQCSGAHRSTDAAMQAAAFQG